MPSYTAYQINITAYAAIRTNNDSPMAVSTSFLALLSTTTAMGGKYGAGIVLLIVPSQQNLLKHS
jgi:hypothetical protein